MAYKTNEMEWNYSALHYFILFTSLSFVTSVQAECGGTLTAPRGIIQTPNFPNEFKTPIFCRWVIDASESGNTNTSIIVYLTQLFVMEGLTFDEYETYDVSYNIVGKRIHAVSEANVSKQKWVITQQNVLVITLELKSVENNHLRLLDYFLNVYGFNITYEITKEEVRGDACTMGECGFTGNCYDDYEEFYCDCFAGFNGPSCSEGELSLCKVDGEPYCQNKGICRHVGSTFVECDCRGGYIGTHCEKQINYSVIEDCSTKIYPSRCGCSKQLNSSEDGSDFSITLRFMQGPSLTKEELHQTIRKQISNYKMEEPGLHQIQITELVYNDWGTEATIQFYSIKRDKKRLDALIQRWVSSGQLGNLTLIDKSFLRNQTLPFIKGIYVNQIGPVREGDSFMLSCVVLGFPSTRFRWYKDAHTILTTQMTSNKWFRIVPDNVISNQLTAILGVDNVSYLDEGTFVCEAEDAGIRHCISKNVEVRRPPSVKIEPMSLTVKKGENFTIKCISASPTNGEYKYTYSWTKNKELLPIKTETEMYEILYPSGSILQVSRIEKPAIFSCLVQDDIASTEISIQVDVFDSSLIHTCSSEHHMNIVWPETAPGTESLQECPKGFTGIVRRCCLQHDMDKSRWQIPDFSECTADILMKAHTNFQALVLGYYFISETKALVGFQNYPRNKKYLLPGEGMKILQLVRDVVNFVNTTRNFQSINNISHIVFDTVGRILVHSNAFINQKQIIFLQDTVRNQLYFLSMLIKGTKPYHQSFYALHVTGIRTSQNNALVTIPPNEEGYNYPPWYPYSLEFNPNEIHNRSFILACIAYKNLSMFLPSRSAFRLSNGTEMEYEVISTIVAVWLLDNKKYIDEYRLPLRMEFVHPPLNNTVNKRNVDCAWAKYATYGYNWNVESCTTEAINSTATRCSCEKPGTYAILATTRHVSFSDEEPSTQHIFVIIGCCFCLIAGTIVGIILMAHCILLKSCLTFLKMQCCFVLACANAMFITALSTDLSVDYYSSITTALAIFLLIALSSHVSKCLLIFTEFVQSTKAPNLNKIVVAISTGVPIITVFASHLTHRTMGKNESSWWLINGSVSFNIFTTAFLIIIILYNVMFLVVMERFSQILRDGNKPPALVNERKKLLRRSFYIFWASVIMICFSVVLVNMVDSSVWNYTFTISNVFLVLLLIGCYILFPETPILQGFFEECRSPTNEYPIVNLEGSPSSSKRMSLLERSPSSRRNRPTDAKLPDIQLSDLQNIPTQARNDAYLKQSREDTQEYMYSPDVVATRLHVELDLVAPMIHEKPEETPLVFCNIAVNSNCDSFKPFVPLSIEDQVNLENVENTTKMLERLQPEGLETLIEEDEIKPEESDRHSGKSIKIIVSDSLDGMLDKISHDLDYLLNRRGSFPGLENSTDDQVRPKSTEQNISEF